MDIVSMKNTTCTGTNEPIKWLRDFPDQSPKSCHPIPITFSTYIVMWVCKFNELKRRCSFTGRDAGKSVQGEFQQTNKQQQ